MIGIYRTSWKTEVVKDSRSLRLQKKRPRVQLKKTRLENPVWIPINASTIEAFKKQKYIRDRWSDNETLFNPKFVPPWQPDVRPADAVTVKLESRIIASEAVDGAVYDEVTDELWYPPEKTKSHWPTPIDGNAPRRGRPSLKIGEERFDAWIRDVAPRSDELRREAFRQVIVYQKPTAEVAKVFEIPYETLKRQLTRVSQKLLEKVNESNVPYTA